MNEQGHKQDQDDLHSSWRVSRALDPMLDLSRPGPVDGYAERERRLLAFYAHEDYHGIRRFLAKPATRD